MELISSSCDRLQLQLTHPSFQHLFDPCSCWLMLTSRAYVCKTWLWSRTALVGDDVEELWHKRLLLHELEDGMMICLSHGEEIVVQDQVTAHACRMCFLLSCRVGVVLEGRIGWKHPDVQMMNLAQFEPRRVRWPVRLRLERNLARASRRAADDVIERQPRHLQRRQVSDEKSEQTLMWPRERRNASSWCRLESSSGRKVYGLRQQGPRRIW